MTQIADSPYGSLAYVNGELLNTAKVDDPPAYRTGSRTGGLGKFSGDIIRSDGVREECVLLQFKEDERHPGSKAGEVTLHLRRPNDDGDSAMVLALTIRHDGLTFHVPANLGSGTSGGDGGRFYHEGGRFVTIYQGDGHVVTYDMHVPGWQAVWSSWSGLLKPLPW